MHTAMCHWMKKDPPKASSCSPSSQKGAGGNLITVARDALSQREDEAINEKLVMENVKGLLSVKLNGEMMIDLIVNDLKNCEIQLLEQLAK